MNPCNILNYMYDFSIQIFIYESGYFKLICRVVLSVPTAVFANVKMLKQNIVLGKMGIN